MKIKYQTPEIEFIKAQTEAYCSGLIDLSNIIDEQPSNDNSDGGMGNAYVGDDL